jgi:lysophospholipase L1-like esterase
MTRTRWLLLGSLALNVVLGALAAVYFCRQRERPELPATASANLHRPARHWFAETPSQPGSLVFLGDSITAEGPWGELVCGVLNRGVHGDTAHGVLRRAEEVLQRRPATIVLMIGVNDVLNGSSATSVAEHVEHFLELARTTSPKTKVVLVSTLPVHEERIDTPGANAQIRALNDVLRRAALAAGQPFVDLHAEFADEVGNLRAELTSDGLHLSPLAYVKWRAALPPFALEAASQ